MSAPASLPVEQRTLIRFQGPDAERYLNGQLSQDVKLCSASLALPACVTDPKGKLQFYVRVFRDEGGSFFVEGPLELRDELFARLSRYLISDDAEAEDVSDLWEMTHVIGAEAAPAGAMVLQCARIASSGYDVWNPVGTSPEVASPLTPAAAEDSRIRHRIPAWGAELTPGLLPPEAGLDRTAISYRKGCYIGQEVLSRMKSAGKLNRRLAALLVGPGVATGDEIGQGVITSVSSQPDPETDLFPTLGYLHKSQFELSEVEVTTPESKGSVRVLGWV